MELYDVMRTTFAVREFTDDPLPDPVLYRILDNARFAPSGGNRQGTHVTVVRDATVRATARGAECPRRTTLLRSTGGGRKPLEPRRTERRVRRDDRGHNGSR